MKGLSKAIYTIAQIGKIITIICIPILIITMFLTAYFTYNVDIKNNVISFNKLEDKIIIREKKKDISFELNGKEISNTKNQETVNQIIDIFRNNSKLKVIIYLEIGFLFLLLDLLLVNIVFKNLEKLFKNIHNGDTPFTLENVKSIKAVAYLLIAVIVLPNIFGFIFELILKMDLNVGFELFNLIEVLFLLSMAYIFEYGYEIQLDSKGKMYSDE